MRQGVWWHVSSLTYTVSPRVRAYACAILNRVSDFETPENRVLLNRIALLVPESDERRLILENLDAIAQAACDLHIRYVNKHGDEIVAYRPELQTALKAQVAAAAMLNPKILGEGRKTVNPMLEAIEHAAQMALEAERVKAGLAS